MSYEKFNLSGKTALITGAGGILGVEHSAALLESGATVILTDISIASLDLAQRKLISSYDPSRIHVRRMDVSEPNEIHALSSEIKRSNIRIDILVNNAAIDPKVTDNQRLIESTRLENFTLEQWNQQVAVGLTGAFLCSQVFGQEMSKDAKGGVILNISSDLSVISPDQRIYMEDGVPDYLQPVKPITYPVIKSGLVGMTRYLSTYWAKEKIRCNSLSPGGVYDGQSETFVSRLSNLIPLGRMADKSEYRSAVQFLCSDASSYINGQNIVMDGGRSIW